MGVTVLNFFGKKVTHIQLLLVAGSRDHLRQCQMIETYDERCGGVCQPSENVGLDVGTHHLSAMQCNKMNYELTVEMVTPCADPTV